jgi:hypothetical protein
MRQPSLAEAEFCRDDGETFSIIYCILQKCVCCEERQDSGAE